MHEEADDRQCLYQPHPFGQEVERARQRSISEAEASAGTTTQGPGIASNSANPVSDAGQRTRTVPALCRTDSSVAVSLAGPQARALATWRTRTAPVVDAYNPTGIPGSAASLGKYYPTNYNKVSDTAGAPSRRSPGTASGLPLSPLGADQEQQLRQYKLDIISQTTQIAREALGRRLQSTTSFKAVETALDEHTRKSVALLRRLKPSSPRITPLLSPGPVTPMNLDGSTESDYLGVREGRLC